jgi:hypothetical protein
LTDDDLGQLLQELEAGQRTEWRDISDRSPVYKLYSVEWKSLAVRDGALKLHWESADGKTRTAQIVIPRSKVTEVLAEIHEGTSGEHLGLGKTLEKARRQYYWLHLRSDVERWCRQCNTCAAR